MKRQPGTPRARWPRAGGEASRRRRWPPGGAATWPSRVSSASAHPAAWHARQPGERSVTRHQRTPLARARLIARPATCARLWQAAYPAAFPWSASASAVVSALNLSRVSDDPAGGSQQRARVCHALEDSVLAAHHEPEGSAIVVATLLARPPSGRGDRARSGLAQP
jgi:hypothetical protein